MDKNTILFTSPEKVRNREIEEVLNNVYNALEEKGYEALDQMVGYILSGDPSYITAHKNARNLIRQIERDDLVEALLKNFLDK
ncbi:MAG: IreB family regulatory phosphoprotein [Anaerovoracaceae bacterium]